MLNRRYLLLSAAAVAAPTGARAWFPHGVGGGGGAPTLQNLTIAPNSAAPATLWTGTVSGCTTGSTVTAVSSDGTTLTVTGTGTTRTVTGTFASAGTPNVTPTETLAGATNTPHTSPATAMNVSSNFIANAAALSAMMGQSKATTGGKTYTLGAVDFGIVAFYGQDWSANPIVLQGTSTGDINTSTRMQWMDFASAKGITFKNFNVYDSHSGLFAVEIGSGCETLVFNGVTIINTTTAVEGTPADGKGLYIAGCVATTSIQFIGQNDATKPDIWGYGNSINIQDSAKITIQNVTLGNNGTDHCLIYGCDDVTIDGLLNGTVYWNAPDHADFIQTDISTHTGAMNNRMTIKNCGLQRPPGLLGSQAYFLAQTNNLVVQNNWSYDAYGNAMSITLCATATVDNNFLMPVTDTGSGAAIVTRGGSSNVSLVNNTCFSATTYAPEGPYPGYSETGTTTLAAVSPGDYTALDVWLAANPTARRRHPGW